ncbi:ABC-F family ATP-binding cassette domain-containing protein [Capsulimonas corticalis]|uniref:ABC-F family ATP-binding cassette domain-containing protein n=1 Tax=Capsulimonas corticalis TaxID=2219043 RepID=UPI000E64A8D6|nr:ABC-F family ATP-binding cassette domain-containing protein [Capsulimonas corticalis]
MSILTVSDLEKGFGVDLLFRGVTFSIAAGQKMGLVGRNGCGKTTLLRILMGLETPDAGRVSLANGRRLGYLRQEAPVHPEHTIWEEVQQIFEPLREMEATLQVLEHEMTDATTDEALERVMAQYSDMRDAFEAAGGYHYSNDLEMVMERLGFTEADHTKLVGSCSGGEQTRLALAKIVLSKPDILILDEPTNHLDIGATEWLEGFLKSYEGAVLLVSHDRYFLDAVTDTIGEVENQKLTVYRGNYSHYHQQKQEQLQRQQDMYENQQAEIARLNDLVKRNMAANATQAHLRLKTQGRIERMEKIDRPKTDTSSMHARFDAAGAGRVGREVIQMEDLAKSYGDRTLFSHVNATVERGERVGLVGPNGAGKTTMVKILLGLETPSQGLIHFGHNVRLSYFSQHATDSLDTSLSVLDTVLGSADMTSTEARNYLARFLFMGDDVFKQVGMLSGGEKNKLALACMILEPCNLLILDEPTNHLDIASCEVLTEMLSNYDGTLMIVSHDRYLLNATTNKTLALTGDGGVVNFEGNYAAWREAQKANLPAAKPKVEPAKKAAPAPAPVKAAASAPVAATNGAGGGGKSGLNFRDLSKARTKAKELVVKTEATVNKIEARIGELETKLASPSDSVQEMVTLAAEHTRLQDELMTALAAWEKAVADQEELG